MAQERALSGSQHPDEWRADLNPESMEGMNPAKDGQTAYDIKRLNRRLQDFNGRELKDIPVVPHGDHLEQGATYIDLNDLDRGEFTARGDERADSNKAYVPKREVDYPLWNRLIGITDPARLDTGTIE